jgi:hypothetical protein
MLNDEKKRNELMQSKKKSSVKKEGSSRIQFLREYKRPEKISGLVN